MFASIAKNYDLTNTVLSAGIHHLWRKKLVAQSGVQQGDFVLDCATGTGDLAIEFKKAVGAQGKVIGSDFCPEMLESAPQKARAQGLEIEFHVADAMQLPYANESFDVVSISFGIRNVSEPRVAIAEMYRVLKPNGRLMILEFGQPQNNLFKNVFSIYSEKILPLVGSWLTGQKDAYQYLQKSSKNFPCRDSFLALLAESAPFNKSNYTSLSGGIAYIYKAVK